MMESYLHFAIRLYGIELNEAEGQLYVYLGIERIASKPVRKIVCAL
jgi:hypothetical protein